MTTQTTITKRDAEKLAVIVRDFRQTIEMLQRVDYTRQDITETSPLFLIDWTKRELIRAIAVLEAVSQ